MNAYLGEIAALITSLSFSTGSVFFTLAGRKVGAMVVNRIRLILAVLLLTLAHLLSRAPLPLNVDGERWLWLGLSGVVGLVLGDIFLFQAFVLIGPRLTMLMMALAPVIAALLAWIFLGETLAAGTLLGIILTLSGIAWVVLESRGHRNSEGQAAHTTEQNRDYRRGILYGVGAAFGQAAGLVLAKPGLAGDFPALTGTLMRMLAAVTVMWLLTFAQGKAGETIRTVHSKPVSLLYILGGAFFGPFIGVTFSLLAVQNTQVGIASTLMALPPVFLLPISYVVFKERYNWQVILGTLAAIGGVAVIFLV